MRTLHVAALAFPTPQGTQAAIHSMLSALAAAGHETHLYCYPRHVESAQRDPEPPAPYRVHRVPSRRAQRSTRSGPSAEKLLLDAALASNLESLCDQLQPDLVVAHHVEAALCCLRLSQPALFLAHTSLSAELASYFSPAWAACCTWLGRQLDRQLCRRSARALAVSPLLAERLSAEVGRTVSPIAVPWPLPREAPAHGKAQARATLGLAEDAEVALYAGNLDAYQGLSELLEPLERLVHERPRLRWLVATESDPRALARTLAGTELAGRTMFTALADESARRRVHAAADVALVPRSAPGGLPIKLLEALARGTPVVTTRRACAGLPIPEGALVRLERAEDWRAGIARVLDGALPDREAGRAYVASHHAASRFVSDLISHAGALRDARSSPLP